MVCRALRTEQAGVGGSQPWPTAEDLAGILCCKEGSVGTQSPQKYCSPLSCVRKGYYHPGCYNFCLFAHSWNAPSKGLKVTWHKRPCLLTSDLYLELEKYQVAPTTGKPKASLATECPPLKDQAHVHMNIYEYGHMAASCIFSMPISIVLKT